MNRARAARDQERATRVLLEQSRARDRLLAERVGAVALRRGVLGNERQNLQQQRIIGIALTHAGEETARHEYWKGRSLGDSRGDEVGGKLQESCELRDIAHGIAKLGLPPARCRSVGERGIRGHDGALLRG